MIQRPTASRAKELRRCRRHSSELTQATSAPPGQAELSGRGNVEQSFKRSSGGHAGGKTTAPIGSSRGRAKTQVALRSRLLRQPAL
jgi:hypothetical protein